MLRWIAYLFAAIVIALAIAAAYLGIADLGRRLGCCRLTLEVREDNQAARRAYARAGFVAAPCDLFLECPLD